MQKYLFILLFLIFSCDEPAIDGSTTTTACNYNIDADKDDGSCLVNDCAGVCGQTATVDNCNRCVGGDIGETACTCYDCDDSECCDCDGNIYETIQIGEQLWMAENLKVTRYNDDSEIQYVQKELSEPDVWANLSTGAYGYYNDDLSNSDTYGNLYNWYAVDDDRGICPAGWHVPRDWEFMHLEVYLGMSQSDANSESYHYRGTNEGSKLAGNRDLWYNNSVHIANQLENNSEFGTSGFSALPASYRNPYGYWSYSTLGETTEFWSSSEFVHYDNSSCVWTRSLTYESSIVHRDRSCDKRKGFSVRCIKD